MYKIWILAAREPKGFVNVTHLVDFVPNQHFYYVVACCVSFEFVQPVFELRERVALCDIIH